MGLFKKTLPEPVFLKETSNAKEELASLEELLQNPNADKDAVMQKIKMIKSGIVGEDIIAFELKHSHLPMYVLHDVYFEDDSLNVQIDYIVFTPWRNYVIECKNLIGDIEITDNGDFIRTLEYNGKKKKEGIYSPISQNMRHIDFIKHIIKKKNKTHFQKRQDRVLDETYKSIIVLANPKTILYSRYAPKKVREQVVRADKLVEYIRNDIKSCQYETSIKDVKEIAESFLAISKEKPAQDFSSLIKEEAAEPTATEVEQDARISEALPAEQKEKKPDVDTDKIEAELKRFRYEQSKFENIKPYYIFNNAQMQQLIVAMPKTTDELARVNGFGEVKCRKYGEQILKILNQ